MFKSFSEIAAEKGKRQHARGAPMKQGLRFSTTTGHKNKNKEVAIQIVLTIYHDLLAYARMMPGDRVEVLFDKERMLGLIKRVKDGGYCVSKQSANTKNASIKATWYPGMPRLVSSKSEAVENVNVTNEGIMFAFPKSTVFE